MTDNQTSDTPLLGAQTSGVDLNTAIMVLVVTAVLYWGWDDLLSLLGLSSDKSKSSSSSASDSRMSKSEELDENDWVYKLIEGNKRAAVFYGSQTGTAQEYALRIAKEGKSRYGFSSLVCDPEEYEFASLDRVPEDKAVIFVIATYGDGEPTENAEEMVNFLFNDDVTFSKGGSTLENLNYVIFGLGNKSYSKYQNMSRMLDKRLTELGATRIGQRGESDELEGTEKGYLAWKDGMWVMFAETLGITEGEEVDMADFSVKEIPRDDKDVYRGELSAHSLKVTTAGPEAQVAHAATYDGKNPYSSPVAQSRELFAPNAERNCIHLEFDITGTNISYQHGDHVGVWACNPDMAVERLLGSLGLAEKRNTVVDVIALDPALAQVPFPTPTTYDAIIRYYLEISAVASRQTLHNLARYAPNPRAKATMERWGNDADAYQTEIVNARVRLGEALQIAAGDDLHNVHNCTVWNIPFDRIISFVPRQKPRWYSISSSPKMNPNSIHATAVVLKYQTPGARADITDPRWVFGVATNYIMNVHQVFSGNAHAKSFEGVPSKTPTYHVPGPRDAHVRNKMVHVPIHTRRSTFRLPTRTNVPVIMVGPGTGIAPFRGFVQERVAIAQQLKERKGPNALDDWAPMYLFYGCRREDEDFLYKDEWPQYAQQLDGKLIMDVAFSRGPQRNPDGSKIYVQTLIWNRRDELARAIVDQGAFLYICGEGQNMGRQVEETFAKAVAEYKGTPLDDGVEYMKAMKDKKRFMTDTWS